MCRIRFGLAGIYFDDFEICQPLTGVEEAYQPLVSHVPLLVGGKFQQSNCKPTAGSAECASCKNSYSNSKTAASTAQRSRSALSPSLLSSSGNGDTLIEQPIKNSSNKSPPPQRDEDTKTPKTIPEERTEVFTGKAKTLDGKEAIAKTNKHSNNTSTGQVLLRNSQPPAKQVRFSDTVEEMTVPSDEAIGLDSDSSISSFTDPPPILRKSRPSDRRSHSAELSRSSMHPHAAKPMSGTGEYSSSDESGVDAGTPWESSHVQGHDKLPANSPGSSLSPANQSEPSSDLESNVDFDGQQRKETRFYRQRERSPLRVSSQPSRKTRAQGVLPEPIFVVRSNKRKTGDSKEHYQLGKSHPDAAITNSKPNFKQNVKYRAASVTNDKEDTGGDPKLRYRDV